MSEHDQTRQHRVLLFIMSIEDRPARDRTHAEWHRAVDTRNPAFDGVFLVALTSTRVCCRPVCPSRLARPDHRRFFATWEAARAAGYRACRRCRPDLAASQAPIAAMTRLADTALDRINRGALDRLSLAQLAKALGTSDRHVRRALKRTHQTTPARLAAAQRLRTATKLLLDRQRSISTVALESGFGSVRRFNAVFRAHYGMTPSAWRASATAAAG